MLIWIIVSFHVSNQFAVFQLSQTDWPVFVVTSQVFQSLQKLDITGSWKKMGRWRWLITNSEIMGFLLRALTLPVVSLSTFGDCILHWLSERATSCLIQCPGRSWSVRIKVKEFYMDFMRKYFFGRLKNSDVLPLVSFLVLEIHKFEVPFISTAWLPPQYVLEGPKFLVVSDGWFTLFRCRTSTLTPCELQLVPGKSHLMIQSLKIRYFKRRNKNKQQPKNIYH